MPRRAFIMSVNPGQHDEYERRHDEIWPDLEAVFKACCAMTREHLHLGLVG